MSTSIVAATLDFGAEKIFFKVYLVRQPYRKKFEIMPFDASVIVAV
jgi:hypothetical protein